MEKEETRQEALDLFPDERKKIILDCTCGGRSIWFDKANRMTIYTDKRCEEYHGTFGAKQSHHSIHVQPDMQCDFTDLPFEDNAFRLVVFDPPHVEGLKESAWLRKKYGSLDADWREMIGGGVQRMHASARTIRNPHIQMVGNSDPIRRGLEMLRRISIIRASFWKENEHILGSLHERKSGRFLIC